jgi:hypothetical protein
MTKYNPNATQSPAVEKMAMISDKLWCESCGEAEQEVSTSEAGLCGDCFAATISEMLEGLLPRQVCGHPYWNNGKIVAVCMYERGTEHAHGSLQF